MELETRCEAELENAEEYFYKEQKIVTENAHLRQVRLSGRERDFQLNDDFRIFYLI